MTTIRLYPIPALRDALSPILLAAALFLTPALSACAANPPPATPTPRPAPPSPSTTPTTPPPSAAIADRPFAGLWITRFDYKTPDDIRTAIDRAADTGFTDVLFQVRGQADAYYRSALEPWGEELFKGLPPNTSDPGFDPLAVAVERSRQRGLRIHAWVNIMPLWKGTTPPRDPRHPYHTRSEWRLRDAANKSQPLNDHYVIVNPLIPSVHDHIVAVCRDIVMRYPIDGLHMDYVRFVSDSMKDPAVYPGDARSIALFEEATGKKFATPEGKAAMRDFKRDRITDLVRRLKREAAGARPGVEFTAAVWRRPDLARDTYLQDAALWLREGTLDRALPMIYTKDDAQFTSDLAAWAAAAPPPARIAPGVGIYLQAPGATGPQFRTMAERKTAGFALFAYDSMFETSNPLQNKSPASVAERAARLKGIAPEVRKYLDSARRAGP
ncbi:MAG: glycoside hydrolase family 10 protein [Phycisphaerales bacterium]